MMTGINNNNYMTSAGGVGGNNYNLSSTFSNVSNPSLMINKNKTFIQDLKIQVSPNQNTYSKLF